MEFEGCAPQIGEKPQGRTMEGKLEGRVMEDLWASTLGVNDWLSSLHLRQPICFENPLIEHRAVAQGTEYHINS